MFGLQEAINFVKLSKKSQVSMLVSCLVIIAIAQSENLLDALAIKALVANTLPVVSLIAIGLFGFIVGAPIYEMGNRTYRIYYAKKNIEGFLKQLTSDEQERLRPYLNENIRTRSFEIQDGTVGGLSNKNILYRSSNVGEPLSCSFAYNIQDITFNILKKHPEYLSEKLND